MTILSDRDAQAVAAPSLDLPGVPVLEPRRDIRSRSRSTTAIVAPGAAISAFALVWMVFTYVLPWSGWVGFALCWVVTFLVVQTSLTALTSPRPIVVDRLMASTVTVGATLIGVALASAVIYTVCALRQRAGPPQLLHLGHVRGSPHQPAGPGRHPARDRRQHHRDRHRGHHHRAARHRRRRLHGRSRGSGLERRAHRRRGHDRAALDRGRTLHLHRVHHRSRARPQRPRRRAGDQRDDPAHHRPWFRHRLAHRAQRPARGEHGARRVAVADGLAGGAAHRASGPDHGGHPRHRPRRRRDLAGAADVRRLDLPGVRPQLGGDELVAAVRLLGGTQWSEPLHPARFRRRDGAARLVLVLFVIMRRLAHRQVSR